MIFLSYSSVGYNQSMRRKTSVTLSEEIVKQLDRASRKGESRSGTIERILRDALAAETRRLADARDLALINGHADTLNAEAEDVLAYQTDL
jgi:metal-responsive CopG/Arc/MetJ family transcriptional regulator